MIRRHKAPEAANPRHQHEWTVFARLELPDDKLLIPGVVGVMTNDIDHPNVPPCTLTAKASTRRARAQAHFT